MQWGRQEGGVYPSNQWGRQRGGVYISMQWGRQREDGVYPSNQWGRQRGTVGGTNPIGMYPFSLHFTGRLNALQYILEVVDHHL